mmetsp:Transcript_47905/g.141525  ORF Transcript_47905/g.141525 Transcript_47905/m.141525 type:complete len:272 (-) Transcript_47905:243-1058(-)
MPASELEQALRRRRDMEAGDVWASRLGDGLYLGAGRDAQRLDSLRRRGVTHVLNCADDVPNFHEGAAGLRYLCLGIADFGADRGASRTFADAARFCEEAKGSGGTVLIHCANGSNRSATVAIAVLMSLRGWSLAQAWAMVHARRAQAAPLADNRAQLLQHELSARGTASMADGDRGTLVAIIQADAVADGSLPAVGARVRLREDDSVGGLVWEACSGGSSTEGSVCIAQDVPAGCAEALLGPVPVSKLRMLERGGRECKADEAAVAKAASR